MESSKPQDPIFPSADEDHRPYRTFKFPAPLFILILPPNPTPLRALCASAVRKKNSTIHWCFTAETPRSQRVVSASHFPLITPSPAQSRMPCTAENPQNPDGSRSTGRRPVIDSVGKFTEPTPPDSLPVNLTPAQGVKDRFPDGPFGFFLHI